MVGVTFKDIGLIAPLLSDQSISSLAELIQVVAHQFQPTAVRVFSMASLYCMGRVKARSTGFDGLDSANMGKVGGNKAYPASEVLDIGALFDQFGSKKYRRMAGCVCAKRLV